MNQTDVIVIGAGWSGLACALTCAQGGARVRLLDAAPQAGGRARAVEVELGNQRYTLDNGQHLLIGAYRDTEHLMRQVGIDPAHALQRLPLSLIYPDGFRFTAAPLRLPLPAPLHLASALFTAHGLSFKDRIALVRQLRHWQRTQWQAEVQRCAKDVLSLATTTLIERLFEPLCLAALNVRLHEASAAIFLRVLRDSIGGVRQDSELWIPRTDLSALFPDAALATLARHGAQVQLHTLVTAITPTDTGWSVRTRNETLPSHAVVLALPPERSRALLESTQRSELAEATQQLSQISSAPIATVYLRYAAHTRLPHLVMALREAPQSGAYGQWIFDRGALDARHAGVFAVVISGQGPHLKLPHQALARSVEQQLINAFGNALSAPPLANAVLVDRRATLQPVPGLQRPPTQLPLKGLYLAGDAADSPYPSTLEGSVRSGLKAAQACLLSLQSLRQ